MKAMKYVLLLLLGFVSGAAAAYLALALALGEDEALVRS